MSESFRSKSTTFVMSSKSPENRRGSRGLRDLVSFLLPTSISVVSPSSTDNLALLGRRIELHLSFSSVNVYKELENVFLMKTFTK